MKILYIDDAKKILSRINQKCIKSMIINNEKYLTEGCPKIYKPLFSSKEKVKYWDGEDTLRTSISSFIWHWQQSFINEFWQKGVFNIIRVNDHFKVASHIIIKLHNLKNEDIKKSVDNTLDLIICNKNNSYKELLKDFKELKHYIETGCSYCDEDTYVKFSK